MKNEKPEFVMLACEKPAPVFSFTNTLPLHKFISKTEKLYKKDDIRGTKYASNICFYEF